jgi:chromosome segregation ATPase
MWEKRRTRNMDEDTQRQLDRLTERCHHLETQLDNFRQAANDIEGRLYDLTRKVETMARRLP